MRWNPSGMAEESVLSDSLLHNRRNQTWYQHKTITLVGVVCAGILRVVVW